MAGRQSPGENCSAMSSARCPLCGTPMRERKRDPLTRAMGFLLLYAAAFLAVYVVPRIDLWSAAALAVLCAWGVRLMRRRFAHWCPACWHEKPLASDGPPKGYGQQSQSYCEG